MTPSVLGLDAPGCVEAGLSGSKMSVLAALKQRGFAVPPGFVVTSQQPGFDPPRAAIATAYRRLGEPAVAVRSSALDEDLPGRSAAGMYQTVLDVVGVGDVLDCVVSCLASAGSAHRTAYAKTSEAAMAVGVMRMVHPSTSGVAFSQDPLGSGHLVVESVRGPLGPLVNGRVVPHHVVVDANGRVVLDEPGDDAPGELAGPELAAVAALTRRVAALLRVDVDVEWAIAAGELWVLQARPALLGPNPG